MARKFSVAFFATLIVSSAFAAHLGHLDANGYPVIIPTVKKLTPQPGVFALAGDDATVLASVRTELTEKGVPDSKEGYVLTVSPRGLAIRARTEVGLFYGKKSVEWMLRNREGDSLKCCTIEDWPDLRLRGLFLEMNELSPSHMTRQCEVLEGLAKLKYNTVLCDFADNLPLSISGDFNRKETLSRADVEAFRETAKKNHITIIPYLQVASHAYWMTRHKDWASLSEGKPSIPWNSLYCLSNPKAQKIVETVVSETCDFFQPKGFQICMDEMWGCPHGLCPSCKDVPIAKLVWRHVEPIQKALLARGIVPIVFQDEFTRTNPTRGQSAYVDILDWMDKRTLVDSWEYEIHPSAIAYRELTGRGFKTFFMSYGTRLLNAINLPRLAHEVGSPGCVLAYWLHLSSDYSRLQLAGANLPASTIWQSVYSWNAGDVDCVRQTYDANHEFARLFAPELVATFRTPGKPVALDGAFTARIGAAGGRYPAFNRKAIATLRNDLALEGDGLALKADADGVRAVVLSGGADDGLPTSATIPVGAKTEGFTFLVFAAPANSFILGENINVKPTVGAFTVKYADGKTAKIPLVYKWTINDWNVRSGVLGMRGISRFNDANGSLASLAALDWTNPRPDVGIDGISFTSAQEKGIAPVLLSVSTHGEAVKAKAAPKKLETLASGSATGFVPLFDFSKGTLDGLRIETSNWGKGVVREIENVSGHGDVLKIVLPVSSPTKVRRVTVDFPIAPETDFGTFAADIFIENPDCIRRSDLYIIGAKGNASLIDYDRGYSPGWTRLVIPRAAIRGTEGKGAPIGERRSIRVGFYVVNETPLTIRVGNAGISQSIEPGRFDIRDAVARPGTWAYEWPVLVPDVAEHAFEATTRVGIDDALDVSVSCANGEDAAAWVAGKMSAWFGVSPSVSSRAVGDFASDNDEAYEIVAKPGALAIRAATMKGVRWAMMTLRQLAQPKRGTRRTEGYEVPALTVKDAPDMKVRMLHLCFFPELTIPRIEREIRMAAYYKFNHVVLEHWGEYRSERHPWYGWKDGKLTVAECRRLTALAKDLGVTLIPEFGIYGHATAARAVGGKNAHLDRDPAYQPLFEPVAGWNWCLTNPEAKKTILELVDEMHEAFGRPPYFHIGCDEALPPSCATCCASDYRKVLADHIADVAKAIEGMGARAMMWHDMLIEKGDGRWAGFYANGSKETVSLLGTLPKSVIVCDWYYGKPRADGAYPTLDHFLASGYDTLACPCEKKDGIAAVCDYARRNGRLTGVMGTMWHRFRGNMMMDIYTFTAANAWSAESAAAVADLKRTDWYVFATHWRQVGWDTPGGDAYKEGGFYFNQVLTDMPEEFL